MSTRHLRPARPSAQARRRTPPSRRAGFWQRWPAPNRFVLVGLTLAAEIGHLVASLVEWPASTPRGVLHIVVAALFGLLATRLYFGASRGEHAAGAVLGGLLPIGALVGALAGVSPYRDTPTSLVLLLSAVELLLAALLTRPLLPRA
ncbi:MAG: hypothetical protein ACRDPK_11795 [Carbonactinosporaceae bacterium]